MSHLADKESDIEKEGERAREGGAGGDGDRARKTCARHLAQRSGRLLTTGKRHTDDVVPSDTQGANTYAPKAIIL